MITDKTMADTFKYVKRDVEDRIKCGSAIYGTDMRMFQIADSVGAKPSPILFLRGGQNVINYGEKTDVPITYYRLIETRPSVMSVCLGNATKDDLYLFSCMADPDYLSLPTIQNAFFDRLSSIQAQEAEQSTEDLTAIHQTETADFKEFMGYMEGAQYQANDIFHHKDYSPEKEYPSYADCLVERLKAEETANAIQTTEAVMPEEQ